MKESKFYDKVSHSLSSKFKPDSLPSIPAVLDKDISPETREDKVEF